jgi:hypothetical protein
VNCGTKHRSPSRFEMEDGMAVLVCATRRDMPVKASIQGSVSRAMVEQMGSDIVDGWEENGCIKGGRC